MVAHGQAGSKTKRTIYVRPSLEYVAHPVYGQFIEVGKDHWAQLVLQCHARHRRSAYVTVTACHRVMAKKSRNREHASQVHISFWSSEGARLRTLHLAECLD